MENTDDVVEKFYMTHEMLSTLLLYPPFTTSRGMRWTVSDELSADLPENPDRDERMWCEEKMKQYESVMEKYGNEFEEASLWMSRYPDSSEAIETSMRLDGKSQDDIDIAIMTNG